MKKRNFIFFCFVFLIAVAFSISCKHIKRLTEEMNTFTVIELMQQEAVKTQKNDIEPEIIFIEDPYEEVKTKMAVIESIGTDREIECFGYDFSYVCRVVMAESGSDSDELQTAVATCILNACIKENWRMSPADVCREYGYTAPAVCASDRVIVNTLSVLYLWDINEEVQDALYFYNPKKCVSDWHEKNEYITTIDEVRFFR